MSRRKRKPNTRRELLRTLLLHAPERGYTRHEIVQMIGSQGITKGYVVDYERHFPGIGDDWLHLERQGAGTLHDPIRLRLIDTRQPLES